MPELDDFDYETAQYPDTKFGWPMVYLAVRCCVPLRTSD
jgi:hypothetical protein